MKTTRYKNHSIGKYSPSSANLEQKWECKAQFQENAEIKKINIRRIEQKHTIKTSSFFMLKLWEIEISDFKLKRKKKEMGTDKTARVAVAMIDNLSNMEIKTKWIRMKVQTPKVLSTLPLGTGIWKQLNWGAFAIRISLTVANISFLTSPEIVLFRNAAGPLQKPLFSPSKESLGK